MSAPDAPKDHTMEIAHMENQQARRAQRQENRADRRERRQLRNLRTGAMTTANASADQFFLDQGLDPSEYSSVIDQAIAEAMSGIAKDDPAPGMYLKNIGQSVYDNQTARARTKASSGLDAMFDDDFENDRIGNDIDDAILDAIYQEERGKATDILENMRQRKVITDTGYQSGIRDLDRQSPSARARLTTLGDSEIAAGRGKLRGVVDTGRKTADTLKLGQSFDPNEYSSNVDVEFDNWLKGLGDSVRSKAPTDLFSTGSLASIAGQGQGPQNTAFNPKALSGIIDEDENEDEDENSDENVF